MCRGVASAADILDYRISFVRLRLAAPETEFSYLLLTHVRRPVPRFGSDMIPHRGLPIRSSAVSCPQMPTTELSPHDAPRSVVSPQASERPEVAHTGECRARARACVCIYLRASMYKRARTWALMQQREQRECTMHLSPAAHPILSVR